MNMLSDCVKCSTYRIRLLSLSVVFSDDLLIHSGYFYSAPSSPLLLRCAPDTTRILCRNFHAEAPRQLRVKDLPKVPRYWRLELYSSPRLFVRKATNLLMSHLAPHTMMVR